MILSSADILRILGGSEIIRLSASLQIVDSKPPLSGREGAYIYVNRFPTLGEFVATWQIWIESDEEDDLIVAEIKRLLPKVTVTSGLMTTVATTEFRSENTQRAPEAPKPRDAQVDLSAFEERFQALAEDVEDRMLLITSGRAGKDGKDGRDGAPGRDGRDVIATEAVLEDLQNVEQNIAKENGQVLTWKDGVWQNLFIPQIVSSISGAGSGGSGGAQKLDDLTDVDAPTPSHGDIITYNSVSGNWENTAAPPADISGNSIDDLSDVDTSTVLPVAGQVLEWNGANWVPASVANGATNLGYTPSPTDGLVTSDTGTDATIPLADGTNAGLLSSAEKASIGTAVQPGDNVSELVNDAGYITDAGVTQIVAGTNITIDPTGGTGSVTINAADGANDADGGDFGDLPNPDAGDFDTGVTTSTLAYPVDGGNFNAGTSEAFGDSRFDGGEAI